MTTDRKPFRILFVCMGNICRSPAAEIVFRKLVRDAGLAERFEIDSAGTIGFHAGRPPDSRMSAALEVRGYPIAGSSRKIRSADLDHFDLILVADQENLADLRALDSDGSRGSKIHILTEFCTEHRVSHVPDPYHGGRSGFEHVADLVEDACAGLLAHLASRA